MLGSVRWPLVNRMLASVTQAETGKVTWASPFMVWHLLLPREHTQGNLSGKKVSEWRLVQLLPATWSQLQNKPTPLSPLSLSHISRATQSTCTWVEKDCIVVPWSRYCCDGLLHSIEAVGSWYKQHVYCSLSTSCATAVAPGTFQAQHWSDCDAKMQLSEFLLV